MFPMFNLLGLLIFTGDWLSLGTLPLTVVDWVSWLPEGPQRDLNELPLDLLNDKQTMDRTVPWVHMHVTGLLVGDSLL